MNYLWAFMILTGIIYGAFHGTLPQITTAALDSAKEAVTLCITMMGVMSFWVGLMRIAEKAGIIEGLSRRMRPVLHFLFPDLPQEHPANEYIATNMIANVFGLGWAATPAGLKAMEELAEIKKEKGLPEEVIPDLAEHLQAGIVVLGTVGRTGISAAFLGNTAEQVIDHLRCDLLVIKPDQYQTPVELDDEEDD